MAKLLNLPNRSRVGRYPKHTFNITQTAFVLQPFMIARVLPGETLKNIYAESRHVMESAPDSIIGWKLQHFYFYVRATDLLLDEFKAMFVDKDNDGLIDTTAYENASGNAPTYCAPGGIDWTQRGLEKITEHYFRDEGEAWNSFTDPTTGLPLAQIKENTWMDSLTRASQMPEGDAIAGATDAGDLDRLMDAFEQLRAIGMAPMSYEDWLRSQGINIPEKDESKPELLAYWSEYKYPVNTIDPADGSPVSAISTTWKKNDNNRRFFKEPGFVIGISCIRPKLYFRGLSGSLCHFADRAWDWMPNYLRDMPETSLKEFTAGTGPIPKPATHTHENYFVDMRDELTHGDQFVYRRETFWQDPPVQVAAKHQVALPFHNGGTNLEDWKYVTTFTNNTMETDGVCSLRIEGYETDVTPRAGFQVVR